MTKELDLTKEDALKIAKEYARELYDAADDELVILEDQTIEKDYGWYFVTMNRKYLASLNELDQTLGNGPFFVLKRTGKIEQLGTAFDLDHYIRKYESGI